MNAPVRFSLGTEVNLPPHLMEKLATNYVPRPEQSAANDANVLSYVALHGMGAAKEGHDSSVILASYQGLATDRQKQVDGFMSDVVDMTVGRKGVTWTTKDGLIIKDNGNAITLARKDDNGNDIAVGLDLSQEVKQGSVAKAIAAVMLARFAKGGVDPDKTHARGSLGSALVFGGGKAFAEQMKSLLDNGQARASKMSMDARDNGDGSAIRDSVDAARSLDSTDSHLIAVEHTADVGAANAGDALDDGRISAGEDFTAHHDASVARSVENRIDGQISVLEGAMSRLPANSPMRGVLAGKLSRLESADDRAEDKATRAERMSGATQVTGNGNGDNVAANAEVARNMRDAAGRNL